MSNEVEGFVVKALRLVISCLVIFYTSCYQMPTEECSRLEDQYYEVLGQWKKVIEEYEEEKERGITEEGKQSYEDTILSLKDELNDLSFRLQDCKKMSQRQGMFK